MKKILPWVFPIFCGLCAFAYIPHFSTLIFAVGCILSLPLPKIRNFLASKGLSGKYKGVLLATILFAGVMATPTAPKEQGPNEPARDITSIDESEPAELDRPKKGELEQQEDPEESNEEMFTSEAAQDEPAPTEQPTQAPEETPEVKPTQEPGAVSTSEPTPETPKNQESGENENGSNFNTYDDENQQKTSEDYVLNSGTMKFHYPSCSSVKKISPQNYSTFTGSRDDVIAKGYSPCGNCHP